MFVLFLLVQHECIPQAVLGMDILCQAKSGMGKTAVFVLATLQQLEPATENQVGVLVMCHTRELAFQISKEYERFSKYMPQVKVKIFELHFYFSTIIRKMYYVLLINPFKHNSTNNKHKPQINFSHKISITL